MQQTIGRQKKAVPAPSTRWRTFLQPEAFCHDGESFFSVLIGSKLSELLQQS
jgi:hypothetical protein